MAPISARTSKIHQSAILCALFDTSAALLAMFIVIPAMAVTTGADLGNGGPGLMFIYLIPVFNNMGGIARIMFIFFYVAVLFAGLSSIINLFETPVAFLQEKLRFNRVTATAVIHIVGVAVALTIQPWTSQWMDVVSIYICPLGALLAGVMFFWVMKKDTALAAVHEGRTARQEVHQRLVLSPGQVDLLRGLFGGPDPGRYLRRHRLSLYTI